MATNVASLRVIDLFRGLSFAYFAPPRKLCVCESFSCVEAPSICFGDSLSRILRPHVNCAFVKVSAA